MKCYQMSSKMWSNVRLKMWPNVTENVGECHWMSSNVKKCRKMWLKCHKKVSWHCWRDLFPFRLHYALSVLLSSIRIPTKSRHPLFPCLLNLIFVCWLVKTDALCFPSSYTLCFPLLDTLCFRCNFGSCDALLIGVCEWSNRSHDWSERSHDLERA